MTNLPPDISLTFLANVSAAPKSVSKDFGKLDARRQRILGVCARTAGAVDAARIPAMPPVPATNLRRSIKTPLLLE